MEENTSALAVVKNRELTPGTWSMIRDMAPAMHQSRLFGVASEEQAAAIMLKGYEVGFGFAASFDMIQVIQGKPGVSPRGCMALILNSPKITDVKVERITKQNGEFHGYKCSMTRNTGFTFTAQFTMDDAQRAGLVKPDSGWEKYPENMCQWRAIGFCADVVAPDITSGLTGLMKMPEQFGVALSEGGDIIEVEPEPAQVSTVPEIAAKPVQVQITLNDLLEKYPPVAIMDANGGVIPANQEQIDAVAEKLAGAK